MTTSRVPESPAPPDPVRRPAASAARGGRPSLLSTLMVSASILLSVAIGTASLAILVGSGSEATLVGGALLIAATAILQSGTGAAIEWRRPGHAIGHVLMVSGPIYAVLGAGWTVLDTLRPSLDPVAFAIANWIVVVLSYPGVALVAGWLPLLFPSGTLPGRRWRWPAGAILVLSSIGLAALAVRPGELAGATGLVNPLGLDGWPSWLAVFVDAMMFELIALFVLAVAGLGVRYRRGDRTERLQIRWLLAAVGVVAAGFAGTAIESVVRTDGEPLLAMLVAIGGILIMPVAIGIAILRYRLYEIDRIISRTVSWAIITGVLLAVFAGLVVGLQAVLAPLTAGNTVAVALSTLAAFALFQPLRRRIQRIVDRRFDRARYDGQRTVDAFADRLRDEIDLEAIRAGVLATVGETVRPSHAAVWLRQERPR